MTTPNLGLSSTTQAAGSAVKFLTWRLLQDDAASSNMSKIDAWAGEVSGSISSLQGGIIYTVDASGDGTDYVATVSNFGSYTDGKIINLILDVTSTGTTTLNINSLGTKSLYKIASNGTAGNLTSGDLVAGRPNFFMYDTAGGYWLWVNGTSADQINIATTTNTEILLGSASGIVGSGISASSLSTTAASSIAPSTASYVVLGADSVLTNERVLTAGSNINISVSASIVSIEMRAIPGMYERTNRITGSLTNITTPNRMMVDVNGALLQTVANSTLSVNTIGNWDSASYTSGSSRAGKDFYIYACNSDSPTPTILFSNNSSAPSGYTSANSRKVGGFHCLCAAVGTISGHALTGYAAGDILPASVWDLKWKPRSAPEGMVYSAAANIWVDIYLMSGTGVNTRSVNGGTISDNRNWMDFVDDAGAVGKRLLRDREFQLIAAGCNEGTNITGSADPTTTGGHTDTAGRRMISNIGCEDVAGVMWQWLDEQSYQYADTSTFGWVDQTGGKGQLELQGATADVKLLAGGHWDRGTICGSRSRLAHYYRWTTSTFFGGRAGVEPE